MRLARVAPGTLPDALGLRSHDEIISINGYRLNDPEQALLAYARLRTAERLSLKLARGGAITEIVYFVR
jgi:general secretion pathway protein C